MKSITESLNERGYEIPKESGDFGIEIETEVKSPTSYPDGFLKEISTPPGNHHKWDFKGLPEFKGHVDLSLRNFGVEYVLRTPMYFKEILKAIEKFGEVTRGVKFIENAPGTSVHLHVNLGKYDFCTLGNFLTVYTIFENVLSYFAKRPSNLFALPIRCAEENHTMMVKLFADAVRDKVNAFGELSDDYYKYAALNLCPLRRFGSVEVRTLRGTTDPELISQWITIWNDLLMYSTQRGLTPDLFMKEYSRYEKDIFFEVFPNTYKLLDNDGYDYLVTDRGVFYAGWLSNSVDDWGSLELKTPEKPKRVAKKSNTYLSQNSFDDTGNPTDWYIPPSNATNDQVDEWMESAPVEQYEAWQETQET